MRARRPLRGGVRGPRFELTAFRQRLSITSADGSRAPSATPWASLPTNGALTALDQNAGKWFKLPIVCGPYRCL
jgi:hypothetical protein